MQQATLIRSLRWVRHAARLHWLPLMIAALMLILAATYSSGHSSVESDAETGSRVNSGHQRSSVPVIESIFVQLG